MTTLEAAPAAPPGAQVSDGDPGIISFEGFGKTFPVKSGSLQATRDVTLSVAQGEFITLVFRL